MSEGLSVGGPYLSLWIIIIMRSMADALARCWWWVLSDESGSNPDHIVLFCTRVCVLIRVRIYTLDTLYALWYIYIYIYVHTMIYIYTVWHIYIYVYIYTICTHYIDACIQGHMAMAGARPAYPRGRGPLYYAILYYNMIWYNMIWHTMVYCTVLYCAVLYYNII